MEEVAYEEVCRKWEENPYYQYSCGEEYFQSRFPCENSGLAHFRKRAGEGALKAWFFRFSKIKPADRH